MSSKKLSYPCMEVRKSFKFENFEFERGKIEEGLVCTLKRVRRQPLSSLKLKILQKTLKRPIQLKKFQQPTVSSSKMLSKRKIPVAKPLQFRKKMYFDLLSVLLSKSLDRRFLEICRAEKANFSPFHLRKLINVDFVLVLGLKRLS